MKPGFWDYVRAAFNARPIGMFVPPNWLGLAAFGLLGVVNPGFWAIGAGLEIGYLSLVATNPRFQRVVRASQASEAQRDSQARVEGSIARLDEADRRRYAALVERCLSILDLEAPGSPLAAVREAQRESLERLTWMYLRLLLTRQAIDQVLDDANRPGESDRELRERMTTLNRRAADTELADELRRSLGGQAEILASRLERRADARSKLAFIDAELARIQQQVELLREQAVLVTDPETLSQRIDEIAATLSGTGDWVRDQQRLYGAMDPLLYEPPPAPYAERSRESQ